jgi:hypothetical protein
MSDEMRKAVDGFKKAALDAGFYDSAKPVILKKGTTMLIKTARAHEGKAIQYAR